eukprot:Mrub_08613.p1 GENE.Mrub_08613~~Mrub_08613.p1  ORF type:complete len:102 (+),score=16.97 Mrub_08613:335-640(+)
MPTSVPCTIRSTHCTSDLLRFVDESEGTPTCTRSDEMLSECECEGRGASSYDKMSIRAISTGTGTGREESGVRIRGGLGMGSLIGVRMNSIQMVLGIILIK